MENFPNLKKLVFKDTSFANLMNKRIYNVLLFASNYDAFTLEQDGRIEEQVFNEYHALSLRYPPRFTLATNFDEVKEQFEAMDIDLVIMMPGADLGNPFIYAGKIKELKPQIPIVALTQFTTNIVDQLGETDLQYIDYVFCWLGNPDLLLAIIKMLEDTMNVEDDVASVGVQVILLVEDSIRYTSYFLPLIYKFVFRQSLSFMTEALNLHERMLRMRGRPKVLWARSFQEAKYIYDKYADNTLGIIMDVSFSMNGTEDNRFAGPSLCKYVRSKDFLLPIIFQSSDIANKHFAEEFHAAFINKNSKTLADEMGEAIKEKFGFGDLIFIEPNTKEVVAVVHNLKELQKSINAIPSESLLYHLSRNDVSRWLYSRAMFPLADFLKQISILDLQNLDEARQVIFDAIIQYRKIKNRGVIAEFERGQFDAYSNFARIGQGSLGGKARGLAFLNLVMKRNRSEMEEYENVTVNIPRTVVLCTDLFDQFMHDNQLYKVAYSDLDDEVILNYFLEAQLSQKVLDDLRVLLDSSTNPIAVRSSSLMEDSYYRPFAGTYSTYMIAQNNDKEIMVRQIAQAIKGVYASVYYTNSKNYLASTSSIIEEEKMGVVLQEVVGNLHDRYFYPSFSGVGRSLNFYPIGSETPEDGVISLALGLGKQIVDGGKSLRVCPKYPRKVLQTSTVSLALGETQTTFLALDTQNIDGMNVNDGFNLARLPLSEAVKHGTLKNIASSFDVKNNLIRDTFTGEGRPVITFANILKHNVMPLSKIVSDMLALGQRQMGCPVEIEFAVNLSKNSSHPHEFYLLQIRPIVDSGKFRKENIGHYSREQAILEANSAMGNGANHEIHDIIYVKTANYQPENNPSICKEIEALNQRMSLEKKKYILIGPGRWGSSDSWLGVPVKWAQISMAKVIVECSLTDYRIDPSQGSHFFQNLTSFGVWYMTINPSIDDGFYDEAFLNNMPAVDETDFLRHVSFKEPCTIIVNGMKRIGAIIKPEKKSV